MKLSIVTPSYNQGRFIERTIRSVLEQDHRPCEYFVQDGGSRDETLDILRRYEGKLAYISQPDGGQTHAVNMAVARTTGDVVGWLNSDDVYYPGALSTVARFFASHADVDVVYGDADHIDAGDGIIESYPTEPWSYPRLAETCFICQPAVFFRRNVFERFGPLDESLRYCMDYEYWLRLGKRGANVRHMPVKLAGSRLHADTKTLGSREKVHREINSMMKSTLGRVPDRWLSNYAHAVVEARVNRIHNPRRFVVEVSLVTMAAALRWNGRVSREQLSSVRRWLRGI